MHLQTGVRPDDTRKIVTFRCTAAARFDMCIGSEIDICPSSPRARTIRLHAQNRKVGSGQRLPWISRNRRLWRDAEATIHSATAFLYAAAVMILVRRLAQVTWISGQTSPTFPKRTPIVARLASDCPIAIRTKRPARRCGATGQPPAWTARSSPNARPGARERRITRWEHENSLDGPGI